MKKLIAISVMLALIVGAVFAETQVGGGVETRFTAATWDNAGTRATTGGTVATSFIGLSGQNDDGTLGGAIRFRYEDLVRTGGNGENNNSTVNEYNKVGNYHKAFVWWKPIPQLKIFLGLDPDGLFGTDDLEGWAYHKGSEGFINNHDWDYWRKFFPGNWDRFGLALSVYPIDGLDINVIVPTGHGGWDHAFVAASNDAIWRVSELYFNGLVLQANYALSGIGKIHLTWYGKNAAEVLDPDGLGSKDSTNFNHQNSDAYDGQKTKGFFGASFLFTMIDGLQAHVGFSTSFLNTDVVGSSAKNPLNFGFAATYAHESGFGAKARGGYIVNKDNTEKKTQFLFTVMPYYNLGSLTVFLDFGLTFNDYDNKAKFGDDTAVPYFINPYVTVPLSGGKFQTGIKINGTGKTKATDDKITVAIPMLLGFNF